MRNVLRSPIGRNAGPAGGRSRCAPPLLAFEPLECRRLLTAGTATAVMAGSSNTAEGGSLLFQINVTNPDMGAARTYTVGYSLGGTAAGGGVDHSGVGGSVVVTVPASSYFGSSQTITVPTLTDNLVEGTETVVLSINSVSGPGGGTIGSPGSVTGTIADSPPIVTIGAPGGSASEDGYTGQFTVSRTYGKISEALPVNLIFGGTATAGADYTALPSTVTIPANAASYSFSVVPIDDTELESTETVTAALAPGSYVVSSTAEVTVSIAQAAVAMQVGGGVNWNAANQTLTITRPPSGTTTADMIVTAVTASGAKIRDVGLTSEWTRQPQAGPPNFTVIPPVVGDIDGTGSTGEDDITIDVTNQTTPGTYKLKFTDLDGRVAPVEITIIIQ